MKFTCQMNITEVSSNIMISKCFWRILSFYRLWSYVTLKVCNRCLKVKKCTIFTQDPRDILNLTLFACQSLLISLWASVSMMMWASVMDLSLIVSFLGQLDGLCPRMFPSESSSRISKSFHSAFYILCGQNTADIWVWFCQWSSTEISGKQVWSRSKRHHFRLNVNWQGWECFILG